MTIHYGSDTNATYDEENNPLVITIKFLGKDSLVQERAFEAKSLQSCLHLTKNISEEVGPGKIIHRYYPFHLIEYWEVMEE